MHSQPCIPRGFPEGKHTNFQGISTILCLNWLLVPLNAPETALETQSKQLSGNGVIGDQLHNSAFLGPSRASFGVCFFLGTSPSTSNVFSTY